MPQKTANQDHTDLLSKFKNFDAVFLGDIANGAPADVEGMKSRLTRVIDALPQRGAIQDHHARSWLDRTLDMAVERMELEHGSTGFSLRHVHEHVMWHIRRASGFGGSEAGTIVKHFKGKRGNFTNAHNLVLEKLLILSPQPSTPEMARGVRAEPWIQKIYHAQTGSRTDDASLGLLRGFRWDRAPFLAGTPDDIVFTADQRRKMVDYKAPSADVCSDYESNGVSGDYIAQLHHYAVIAMAAGCRFSEMSVEVHDPRFFEVVSYPVTFDREIAKGIVAASRRLWLENIMPGIVPDAPSPDNLDADDPDLIEFGHQAAMYRAIKEVMEVREKELLERISILGTEMHDKATGKMALTVADYNRKRAWDEGKLVSLAKGAGLDLQDYLKGAKSIDAKQAVALLTSIVEAYKAGEDIAPKIESLAQDGLPVEMKLDLERLALDLDERDIDTIEAAEVRASFGLTRKKKGPEAERLAKLRDSVTELAEALDDVVRETAQKIILGQPTSEEVLPDL